MNHVNGWPEWGVISPSGKLFNAKKFQPNKTVLERNKYYSSKKYTHSDAVIQASRNKTTSGFSYYGSQNGWIRWYRDMTGTVYFEDLKHKKETSRQRIKRVEKILHDGGIEFHTVIDDKGRY